VIERVKQTLNPCWKHKDEHILWAENEEYEDNESAETAGMVSTSEIVGVPELQLAERVEELVEVS
jgi:hypothetical protein